MGKIYTIDEYKSILIFLNEEAAKIFEDFGTSLCEGMKPSDADIVEETIHLMKEKREEMISFLNKIISSGVAGEEESMEFQIMMDQYISCTEKIKKIFKKYNRKYYLSSFATSFSIKLSIFLAVAHAYMKFINGKDAIATIFAVIACLLCMKGSNIVKKFGSKCIAIAFPVMAMSSILLIHGNNTPLTIVIKILAILIV